MSKALEKVLRGLIEYAETEKSYRPGQHIDIIIIQAQNALTIARQEPTEGNWISAEDYRRNCRALDVALNGEDAAPRPSLIDILAQVQAVERLFGRPLMDVLSELSMKQKKVSNEEFSTHEALHTASVLADTVAKHLCEHPFIEKNQDLHALADAACSKIYELYQKIGSDYSFKDKPLEGNVKIGFIDGIHFTHHLEADGQAVPVYSSKELCLEEESCANECGVVKVEIREIEWVVKQSITQPGKTIAEIDLYKAFRELSKALGYPAIEIGDHETESSQLMRYAAMRINEAKDDAPF